MNIQGITSMRDIVTPTFIREVGGDPSERMLQRSVNIEEGGRSAFDQFLSAAMNVVNETNIRQIESDIAQMEFATGQSNDMLSVIFAQDRAGSSLNFTTQVTNRIIEAYREIMRMQV